MKSLEQFCKDNSISRTHVYREWHAGRLVFTKVGGSTRIKPEDEQAWLASLPVSSSGQRYHFPPATDQLEPLDIAIEKGVPLPPKRNKAANRKYPFGAMEVGDCFSVPLSGIADGVSASGGAKWDLAARNVSNAASAYGRAHGKQFSFRTYKDLGIVRCWRVA